MAVPGRLERQWGAFAAILDEHLPPGVSAGSLRLLKHAYFAGAGDVLVTLVDPEIGACLSPDDAMREIQAMAEEIHAMANEIEAFAEALPPEE